MGRHQHRQCLPRRIRHARRLRRGAVRRTGHAAAAGSAGRGLGALCARLDPVPDGDHAPDRPRHVQFGARHVRYRHRLAAADGARLRRRRPHHRKRARQLVLVRRAGRHRQGEADRVRRVHRARAGADVIPGALASRSSHPRHGAGAARRRRARHRHAAGLRPHLCAQCRDLRRRRRACLDGLHHPPLCRAVLHHPLVHDRWWRGSAIWSA